MLSFHLILGRGKGGGGGREGVGVGREGRGGDREGKSWGREGEREVVGLGVSYSLPVVGGRRHARGPGEACQN